MERCLHLATFIVPLLTPSFAQGQYLRVNNYYGGAQYDIAHDMVRTSDGGYVLAGNTASFGPNAASLTPNGYVIKVDEAGELLWTLHFGDTQAEELHAIAPVGDGSFLVAGFTRIPGAILNADILVARVSATGALLWAKRYGTAVDAEYAWDLCALGNDQFVLAGSVGGTAIGSATDALVMKINAAGDVSWTNRSNTTVNDEAWGIAPAADGGLFVTGTYSNDAPPNYVDLFIAKMSATGSLEWRNQYVGADSDGGEAIVGTPDGGAVVAGFGVLNTNNGMIATRVSANGTVSWSEHLSFAAAQYPHDILLTSDGRYLITGTNDIDPSSNPARSIFLLEPDGELVTHTLHMTSFGPIEGHSAVENPDHTFTFAGLMRLNTSTQAQDMSLTRSGIANFGTGDVCLAVHADGTTNEPFAYTLSPLSATPAALTYAPTALSWTAGTGGIAGSVCSNVGVNDRDVDGAASLQLVPNPAIEHITLRLSADETLSAFEVIDARGTVVRSERSLMGTSTTLDVSHWPSGIYLCRAILRDGRVVASQFVVD